MVMDPDIFLPDKDMIPLTRALTRFASKVRSAEHRLAILSLAPADDDFVSTIDVNLAPPAFATTLTAEFKDFRVSDQKPDYHPMINVLAYIEALRPYRIDDADSTLFRALIGQGRENFKALFVRRAVGRLESPQDHPIGTGILVNSNILLTCSHIFDNIAAQSLWVRFGYKQGRGYVEPGEAYELDRNFTTSNRRSDYALLKINAGPALRPVPPVKRQLDKDYTVRLIHHPLGQPLVVSDAGRVVCIGEDYMYHTVPTDNGSSGAPIFDKDWHLVAIQLGNPDPRRTPPFGATTGLPLLAFWDTLVQHLPSLV